MVIPIRKVIHIFYYYFHEEQNQAIFHVIVTQLGWGPVLALNARRPYVIYFSLRIIKYIYKYHFVMAGICLLPQAIGSCRNFAIRWHYDGSKCEKFWYSGCTGNGNNFDTEYQCQQACSGYASKGKNQL